MAKIAIIGSGPAGLACANILVDSKKEIEVTVYDKLEEFGGMPAYGIPEFIAPLENAKQQIERAREKGIIFIKKKIESVKELLKEFDFVVLAIGAGKGFKLGIEGEENKKIVDALDFLKKDKFYGEHLCSSGEVAVIGGGNASIDAALVATKQGAKVTLIYRRTEKEMPAFENELNIAKKANVIFNFLRTPVKYIEENGKIKVICAVMELGEKDESGRASPIDTNKRVEFVFDKVLLSIGQRNDLEWLEKDGIKSDGKNVLINEHFQTSNDKVFACGDVIYGAKNIGEATLSGINCAKAILKQ